MASLRLIGLARSPDQHLLAGGEFRHGPTQQNPQAISPRSKIRHQVAPDEARGAGERDEEAFSLIRTPSPVPGSKMRMIGGMMTRKRGEEQATIFQIRLINGWISTMQTACQHVW